MMTQREVSDSHNTTWTCVQAYAGVETAATAEAVERSTDSESGVTVVCTPTGGAQTVRLNLAPNWQESLSDEELAQAIAAAR